MTPGTVLFVDGGCSGNGQRDQSQRQMVAVVTDHTGAVISEQQATGGSNNIAELLAVRDALRWCDAQGIRSVEVRTDSKNNTYWVRSMRPSPTINDYPRVVALLSEIAKSPARSGLHLVWVPRAQNLAGHYIERVYGL